MLPEAFAVCREASKRVLGMRHFDVQLIGGMVLHSGKIAEMKTGEGKTLVATLPVYLNALEGKGVHVVTVNDYLARRDAEWMGRLYNFLGLSVGVILHGLNDQERQDAYNADVTYGQNNSQVMYYLTSTDVPADMVLATKNFGANGSGIGRLFVRKYINNVKILVCPAARRCSAGSPPPRPGRPGSSRC